MNFDVGYLRRSYDAVDLVETERIVGFAMESVGAWDRRHCRYCCCPMWCYWWTLRRYCPLTKGFSCDLDCPSASKENNGFKIRFVCLLSPKRKIKQKRYHFWGGISVEFSISFGSFQLSVSFEKCYKFHVVCYSSVCASRQFGTTDRFWVNRFVGGFWMGLSVWTVRKWPLGNFRSFRSNCPKSHSSQSSSPLFT